MNFDANKVAREILAGFQSKKPFLFPKMTGRELRQVLVIISSVEKMAAD